MSFTVGETVVYPNHGAAVIEDIEMRTIKGEDREYLVLRIVAQQDLVVRVPACNLDLVGVRDVVDKDGLDRVFDILRAAHVEEPTNWSRRYKANLEKLHSGDVMKVSEVVRDLWRRERDRGLSAGEKRMLAKARQILVSELALAENTNEDKAEAGVHLLDLTAPWEAVSETGMPLVWHDALCPATPPELIAACVRRAVADDVVVAAVLSVTDTVKELIADPDGPVVGRTIDRE